MEGTIPLANNWYGLYEIKWNYLYITLNKIVKFTSQSFISTTCLSGKIWQALWAKEIISDSTLGEVSKEKPKGWLHSKWEIKLPKRKKLSVSKVEDHTKAVCHTHFFTTLPVIGRETIEQTQSGPSFSWKELSGDRCRTCYGVMKNIRCNRL